jgi:predicted aspartyl protease
MTKLKLFSLVILMNISLLRICGQNKLTNQSAKLLEKIPFSMLTGGVIMVTGNLNNYPDSLHFIIDTGSGGISLDSLTCIKLGISLETSDILIRGLAGIRKVKFLNNASLILQHLKTDSLNFHVNDYDILTSVYGVKIDGIIGFSFLKKYIVNINYDSSYIEIYSNGIYNYPKHGFILHPNLQNIPVVKLMFKEQIKQEYNFYFDTGAGLCFLLSDDYVNNLSIFSVSKRKPLLTQAEGLGGKMIMKLTTIKALHIGPYKFKNVPTHIFEDVSNITSYPILGGLVGNDILRRFNVTLNYQKKEIHLIPNSFFKDPFDYAYTGLGLYDNEGRVVIEDIIPNSPGDKAGFMPGDAIMAINSNFTNDIRQYKTILQSETRKIKVIVLRAGELIEISIKPMNIMK